MWMGRLCVGSGAGMPLESKRGMFYSLFCGADLVDEFRDAEEALDYMARNADDLLGSGCALLVSGDDGMPLVALVDARDAHA